MLFIIFNTEHQQRVAERVIAISEKINAVDNPLGLGTASQRASSLPSFSSGQSSRASMGVADIDGLSGVLGGTRTEASGFVKV